MFDFYFFGDNFIGIILAILLTALWIWMIIESARHGDWIWLVLILIFFPLPAILYFFLVHRGRQTSSLAGGFELPGAADRKRIQALKTEIHNLDKALSYLELGDIYFNQNKLKEAEEAYRAAYERDGEDIDIQAHLGQCLLRRGEAKEARPLLEKVMRHDGNHDYGHSMMAYAETLVALGNTTDAMKYYEHLAGLHTYGRARVGYAELLIADGQKKKAHDILNELIEDEPHMVDFQRRRELPWIKKAKALLPKTES